MFWVLNFSIFFVAVLLENSQLSLELSQTGMSIARSNALMDSVSYIIQMASLMHLHPFQDSQNYLEPTGFQWSLGSFQKMMCASSILSWRNFQIFSSQLKKWLETSDFLTEVDDLCTWRTKSPRKLCTFWLGQKASARSLWQMRLGKATGRACRQ